MLQEALAVVRDLSEQNKELWKLAESTQRSREKWEAIARKAVATLEKVVQPK